MSSGVGLYTMYRGLYGNGVLGSHGNVLRHTVSARLLDATGRFGTPPVCKWMV